MGIDGAAFGVLVATVIMTVLMCDLLPHVTTVTIADIVAPQRQPWCAAAVAFTMLLSRLAPKRPAAHRLLCILRSPCYVAPRWAGIFLLYSPFQEVRQLVQDVV